HENIALPSSAIPLFLSPLCTLVSAFLRLGDFSRLGANRLSARARHTPGILSWRSHLHWELLEWRLRPGAQSTGNRKHQPSKSSIERILSRAPLHLESGFGNLDDAELFTKGFLENSHRLALTDLLGSADGNYCIACGGIR